MILRRVIDHVKTQNWTAIALDFVIVVLGVFIGIQLGNWNERQSEKHDYRMAIERYKAELRENIAVLDIATQEGVQSLDRGSKALDALLTCEDTPENRALVEAGIIGVTGTAGLSLQTNALRDLTESPALLARQTEAERRLFNTTRHRFDIFLREATFAEMLPLEERVQNNPMLKVGPSFDRRISYFGLDYSRSMRSLRLDAPLDVACKDDALVKYFYTWERWQSVMPVIIGVLRDEMERNLEALE